MKLDLINNANDRELVMKEENKPKLLDLLRKFGNVVDYMTEPMVASFFKVADSTIMWYGNEYNEELSKYGYKVLKGEELKEFKKSEINRQSDTLLVKPNARALRLYPIEAVVVIGMMLRESKIAEQLRREIIEQIFNNNPQTNKIDALVLALYHCKGGIEAVNIGRELVQEELKPIKKELERKGIKHPYTLRNVASCIENMSDIQIKKELYNLKWLDDVGSKYVILKDEYLTLQRKNSIAFTDKGLDEFLNLFKQEKQKKIILKIFKLRLINPQLFLYIKQT